MLRGFGLAVALLVAGCGGTDDSGSTDGVGRACEAGRVAECPCEDGSMGIQTCNEDGSAWGECVCVDETAKPSGSAGESAAPPQSNRPVAYFASEVCEPYEEADAKTYCATALGQGLASLYPVPYQKCRLPAGGVLAECVDMLGPACCGR